VIGHIIDVNPAHAVRGPKYVVKKGKTPVLTAEEARELLDSNPERAKHGGRREAGTQRTLTGRVARSRTHCGDGVQLRTYQRRAGDESRRLLRTRPARLGASPRERRQGARSALPSQSGKVPR
jgi:hypothetical protein